MKKQSGLIKENFNDLLNWFSSNQEEAGEKYEEIRNGLIRFFYFKGCTDAENLADEAINRVASKLPVLNLSENVKPINLFYGFASKIYLEYVNRLKKQEIEFNADLHSPIKTDEPMTESENKNYKCLKQCLAKLSDEESNLVVEYYSLEKSEKIEHRKKLAETMQMKIGAIHIKIHRLRKILRKCIEKCVAEK
ncbi:MAG: hypothetical protein ACR2MG_11330 [Pyrinomonadaceae bacterium]